MSDYGDAPVAWSSFISGFLLASVFFFALATFIWPNTDAVRCESVGGQYAKVDGRFRCVQTTPVITPSPRP